VSELLKKVYDTIDQQFDDQVKYLQDLVRQPSILGNEAAERAVQEVNNYTFHGMNLDVTPIIADHSQMVHLPGYSPVEWSFRNRPLGMVGVWKSRRGGGKSLVLNGHVDVVDVTPLRQWKRDPFGAQVEGDRLFGRGAADMKGGVSALVFATKALQKAGIELKGDLILETVVDEEFGGANGTLACRLRGYNADAAICPEPNNMLISAAHRGGQQFRLHTCTEGIGMGFGETIFPDPITALGHLLVALDQYNQERQARPKPKGFENDVFPLMPFSMRAGEMLPWGTGESIPQDAWVEFWIEIPPGVTRQQLQGELKDVVARATEKTPTLQRVTTRWEERTRFLAGSSMPDDHPILGMLAANFSSVTGQAPSFEPAPFACDGFIFNLHSPTPAVVLGPRGANAHGPDEWVELEDLVALTKIYALTIAGWLT